MMTSLESWTVRGSTQGSEASCPTGHPETSILLVGGFPCQDYSVAKTLRQAHGLVGKKGVLWWRTSTDCFDSRSNTDGRFASCSGERGSGCIKSPSSQRGRDFAVMLASLADLGYEVEWRIANAADYGFPQKRRRVSSSGGSAARRQPSRPTAIQWRVGTGTSSRTSKRFRLDPVPLHRDVKLVSDTFGLGARKSEFGKAGVMRISSNGRAPVVYTGDVSSTYVGDRPTWPRSLRMMPTSRLNSS